MLNMMILFWVFVANEKCVHPPQKHEKMSLIDSKSIVSIMKKKVTEVKQVTTSNNVQLFLAMDMMVEEYEKLMKEYNKMIAIAGANNVAIGTDIEELKEKIEKLEQEKEDLIEELNEERALVKSLKKMTVSTTNQ